MRPEKERKEGRKEKTDRQKEGRKGKEKRQERRKKKETEGFLLRGAAVLVLNRRVCAVGEQIRDNVSVAVVRRRMEGCAAVEVLVDVDAHFLHKEGANDKTALVGCQVQHRTLLLINCIDAALHLGNMAVKREEKERKKTAANGI